MARRVVDRSEVDHQLRLAAQLLPGGYALHRGLSVPRALMNLAVRAGRLRGVESIRVNSDVTVRVHRPAAAVARGPALLWVHGGGTIMGEAGQDDKFCRRLTDFTDISIAAVDYRTAPEHPYPAPLEDCYAALLWLTRQPWVDPKRVAIGGASAGGGLTAALALMARDRGEVAPAFQMMAYPMLDDRTGATAGQPARVLWSGRDNQIAWQWYLSGADPDTAVPGRRTDLAGLAPAWIGVGTLDLFYEESVAYGRRLQDAGVPTEVHVAGGAYHAFDMIAPNASVSQRFFASQCRSLRAAAFDDSGMPRS